MAISYTDIGLSQPAASTITMKVASVSLTRNSTAQHQELLTLADPETTNALVRVTAGIPPSTSFGAVVRQALGALISAASTMGSASTGSTIVSSAATVPYIVAYKVTSTAAGPLTGGFYAGSTLLWPILLWADGGQPRDSQEVSAPGFVFKGQADRPVELRISSTGAVSYGITYWTE